MIRKMDVEGIEVQVSWKQVKNLNMRIKPPLGQVYLSVPLRTKNREVRDFIVSKLDWIRKHQIRMREESRPSVCFEEGELHGFLGRDYRLVILEGSREEAYVERGLLKVFVKNDSIDKRKRLVESFYRRELDLLGKSLLSSWEEKLGVEVREFRIKRMKTRWGSCNIRDQRIWLNLELAK